MMKKNSKFTKFFVVCLVCVIGLFGFNVIVNADSINDTPDYQYMKTSYYNWDNITWYTENSTFVTGSNDTFSSLVNFYDRYFFINDDLSQKLVVFDIYAIPNSSNVFFNFFGDISVNNESFVVISGVYLNQGRLFYLDTDLSLIELFIDDSIELRISFDYMNDQMRMLFVNYIVANGGQFVINDNNDNIPFTYNSFIVTRYIQYNSDLSDIDLFVYDCDLSGDFQFNSIVFEKSDFFVKVGDLNSLNIPMISASVLNGGFDITFEISGFVRDINGDVRDLSIVTDSRIDVLGYQTLYPTFQELFGNVDSINNDSMMYINNIRVLVEFPNNYVDNLSYRYSVSSIESNNIKYGGAFNSWVNSSINTNLGSSLVDNINTFLQIEILPGLSFFGILLLAVAVPMLIWILKIFFGG